MVYFCFIYLLHDRDSDFENGEMAESVREEKRRKQMESMADELFIYEKVSKRDLHDLYV